MTQRWCPAALRPIKVTLPIRRNMGDGYTHGRLAGAAITRCKPRAVIHPVNFSPLGPGIQTSWLTINRDGDRFCCEVGFEPIVTNARMNPPGNLAWAVWDRPLSGALPEAGAAQGPVLYSGLDEAVEASVASANMLRPIRLKVLPKS
jgi:hypothetical protein